MRKKKFLKVVIGIFFVIAILIIGSGIYLKGFLPNIKVKDMKVEATAERVERGKYLANHVSVCVDCHSKRDWTKFSGPIVPGTEGMGGEVFDQKMGFPGKYIAPNITPYYLANWSDGEIYRAITSGVGKRNNAIFPVMPYGAFGTLDEEDIYCIIAYLRSMPSIKNETLASKSDFPMNFIINTIPHKASHTKLPLRTDTMNYGNYMTTASACIECHTKVKKGNLIAGTEFGGGREFPFSNGSIVRSSNISPDKETGLGTWTNEVFINIFRFRSDSTTLTTILKPEDFNSIMPWTMFGKMTEEDLRAIFAHLKTVKSIKNSVEIFTASTSR